MKGATVLAGLVILAACGGSGTDAGPTAPPAPTVKTITVSPDNALLSPGDSMRLSAVVKDASDAPISGLVVTWASSSQSIATVSASGMVTAVVAGAVSVTASIGRVSGAAAITVQPASSTGSVKAIQLSYPTALLANGQALQLDAALKDSVGKAITGRSLKWSSVNTSVVRLDSIGQSTTLTATGAGTTSVTATIEGVSATSTVTVIAFSAIAPGPTFSCALATYGQIFCAGEGYGSLAKPVGGSLRFSSVSADGLGPGAGTEACGFGLDGSVYCWGANDSGQLGDGDRTTRAEPTRMAGNLQLASISIGRDYACGLTSSGDAYCWGDGNTGQLGARDTLSTTTPVAVDGGLKFAQLEAGYGTTCGLTTAGKAWCWGRNDLGQLGQGNNGGQLGDQITVPAQVGEPMASAVLKQIVTRGPKTCAITAAGVAYCWGNNTVFELGANTKTTCYGSKPCSLTPLPVTGSAVFTFLSATQFATCGLTVSNTTLCWGLDFENIFGTSETVPQCATSGAVYGCTFTPVAGPAGLITLTGARSNYCGMKSDGIAYCWGGNEFGQRGWGGSTPDRTPRAFSIAPASVP
jgi:hypothetical protein